MYTAMAVKWLKGNLYFPSSPVAFFIVWMFVCEREKKKSHWNWWFIFIMIDWWLAWHFPFPGCAFPRVCVMYVAKFMEMSVGDWVSPLAVTFYSVELFLNLDKNWRNLWKITGNDQIFQNHNLNVFQFLVNRLNNNKQV